MNEIRRPDRQAEEIARIRAIVKRHEFPSFVTGFDVRLGEFDGEAALWVEFYTIGERPETVEARRARSDTLRVLKDAVHVDLLTEIADRYPYYRFSNAEQGSPIA